MGRRKREPDLYDAPCLQKKKKVTTSNIIESPASNSDDILPSFGISSSTPVKTANRNLSINDVARKLIFNVDIPPPVDEIRPHDASVTSDYESASDTISADDVRFLILFLQRKCRLSDDSLNSVINLLNFFLPEFPVKSTKTLHKLTEEQFFSSDKLEIRGNIRLLCELCNNYMASICLNSKCKQFEMKDIRANEFVVFNIKTQLELVLRHHGLSVLKFLSESITEKEYIDDITNGSFYRR